MTSLTVGRQKTKGIEQLSTQHMKDECLELGLIFLNVLRRRYDVINRGKMKK